MTTHDRPTSADEEADVDEVLPRPRDRRAGDEPLQLAERHKLPVNVRKPKKVSKPSAPASRCRGDRRRGGA